MQYVNNDMDDLFKKAAENYPLRTDGADWDAISARLAESGDNGGRLPNGRFKRNYLWLLLLLLIPAVMLIHGDRPKIAAAVSSHRHSDAIATAKPGAATNAQSNGSTRHVDSSPASPLSTARSQSVRQQQEAIPHTKSNTSTAVKLSTPIGDTRQRQRSAAAAIWNNLHSINHSLNLPAPTHRVALQQTNTAAGVKLRTPAEELETVSQSGNVNRHARPLAQEHRTSTHAVSNATGSPDNTISSSSSHSVMGHEPVVNASIKEDVPVDSITAIRQPKSRDTVSTNKTTAKSVAAVKKKESERSNASGWYYGLITGPDLSTIKSQKVTNVGYTIGGLAGYSFNRHWSLEAGAFWDNKKYYTKGDYFDKAKANFPSSVQIKFLDGYCQMVEFPLAVRYNLPVKKNSFFVTGGLTSYLMKKEAYNYGADASGTYYENFRSYKNSGNHLFSNLQFSAGYSYNLSHKLSIRIEPYIKMPLKDIGIGAMPVSSKGLYIGIMRRSR